MPVTRPPTRDTSLPKKETKQFDSFAVRQLRFLLRSLPTVRCWYVVVHPSYSTPSTLHSLIDALHTCQDDEEDKDEEGENFQFQSPSFTYTTVREGVLLESPAWYQSFLQHPPPVKRARRSEAGESLSVVHVCFILCETPRSLFLSSVCVGKAEEGRKESGGGGKDSVSLLLAQDTEFSQRLERLVSIRKAAHRAVKVQQQQQHKEKESSRSVNERFGCLLFTEEERDGAAVSEKGGGKKQEGTVPLLLPVPFFPLHVFDLCIVWREKLIKEE